MAIDLRELSEDDRLSHCADDGPRETAGYRPLSQKRGPGEGERKGGGGDQVGRGANIYP